MLPQVATWLLVSMGVGLVLVVVGLRGRRLNNHPVCRSCSFDLVGCPDGTVTCPECGAGLKRERAIRIGQRQRVYSALVVGVLAILVPVASFALVGYALVTASSVHQFKPTAVLLWEARRADGGRLEVIAAELHDRAVTKKFYGEQYARVISAVLEQQAEPLLAWSPVLGDIIEQAKIDGELTEEQEKSYRQQAAILKWEVRPRVRSGDSLPLVITLKESRVGTSTMLVGQMVMIEARIAGKEVTAPRPRVGSMFTGYFEGPDQPMGWFYAVGDRNQWGNPGWQGGRALLSVPQDLEPGRHEVTVRVGIKIDPYDYSRFGFRTLKPDDENLRPMEWTTLIEVEPSDRSIAELIEPTEEVTEELRGLLNPTETRVYGAGMSSTVMQQFGAGQLPVPVAFDVYWRQGEREVKLGSLASEIDTSPQFAGHWWGEARWVSGHAQGIRPSSVTVILRPNVEVAARTVGLTRIYGGEITFEDVAVQREDAGRGGGIIRWLFGW